MPVTNSLERSILLLDLVAHTPGGLRHAEISRQLQLPRSTCSWILKRLAEQGFLAQDADTGRYRIGLKVVALAHGALRELGFRAVAEPVLYRVASETGLAAGIGVLETGHVLLVDRVEPPELAGQMFVHNRARHDREIGRELPAHSTALGKVLLANLSRRELLNYLDEQTLTKRTSRTIVSRESLLLDLRRIRQRGYAIADGEYDAALRAIAAPIVDYVGNVRAALSLNGTPALPIWRKLPALVACLTTAARDISSRNLSPQEARKSPSASRWSSEPPPDR